MIYTYNPAVHAFDFKNLPPEAQRAFIGKFRVSNLIRLTETYWAFREISGSGPYLIGPLEELIPHMKEVKSAIPYKPPKSELDNKINIDLGL